MHELAVCQALMQQVEAVARQHDAHSVASITLGIGPLSGVEEQLLKHAYPLAAAGTIADGADLQIQTTPVKVRCNTCGEESEAEINRLVCSHCGDWRTQLVSGDELVLITVELNREDGSGTGAVH